VFTFMYAPIVVLIVFSFNKLKSRGKWGGFTLDWYRALFENDTIMSALWNTLSIALLSSTIAIIVGTMAAIGIFFMNKHWRKVHMNVAYLPVMNADIVTGISLLLVFSVLGIRLGYVSLLLAHVTFNIPYVILSVMPKIRSLDPNLADAAMDLGAKPFQAITKVIVPQIMPGVVSGALIAFTMSVDDFIISYFVTGNGVKNLSIMVYTMSKRVNPSINAVSTLVVVIITLALLIINVMPMVLEKQKKKAEMGKRNVILPIAGAVCVVAVIVLVFSMKKESSDLPYAGQTLRIYMPGEYVGEEIFPEFEAQTGAVVVMENFDSNEQMYIKVANGESYDILIPSDYMIQRLIEEDYLQKMDPEQLTCMEELLDAVKNQPYDITNEYSVPYFWGTVGIVYDKAKVSMEDLEREGYNIFLNEKYKGDIYLYDSERDSFMMALKALGYSMNTENQMELDAAFDWLVQCVTTMKPEIVTDEIIDNMAQGRKALGLCYSGDATYIISENEEMGFYMPEQGTNLWFDSMVIPANAENTELAHEFINFISSYDYAYANSAYVGYTSPNWEVMDVLSGEDGDFEGINAYLPRTDNELDEVFVYNAETRKVISNLWSKVKIAASNAN